MSESHDTPIEAEGFFPDLPGQRLAGILSVAPAEVSFLAPGRDDLRLPLDGLGIRVSGIQHEHLLLEHPDQPGYAVAVGTAALLDHPLLLAKPALAKLLLAARGQARRGRMIVPGCIGLVVVTLVALWLLKDPAIAWVADQVPHGVEGSLGDLLFKAVEAQSPMVEDAALDQELEALVAPLAAEARKQGLRLDFHLVDDPTLNAFALPGGHVVIHSGLLMAAEQPEEMLGVVAHEIAHVTERHSLRQMVGSAGLWVLFQSVFGDFSGLAGVVTEGGYRLLTLSFSRDQELEADAVGFENLVAAKVDPRGLGTFFDRIEKEMGGAAQVETALNFLSTHPVTAERKRLLEERLAALGSRDFAPVAVDFATFKANVLAQAPKTRSLQEEAATENAKKL